MNIVIVGGGLAGLTAALALQGKGTVSVIESADACGGLLRSWRNSAGVVFDLGTHVPCDTGEPVVDSLLFDRTRGANWNRYSVLRAGNFFGGRLTPGSPHIDARSLPDETYRRGMSELVAATAAHPQPGDTLESFLLRKFGRTFTEQIQAPVLQKVFGCRLDELQPDNFFAARRLICFDAAESRRLKHSAVFDEKIAFHSFNEGVGSTHHYYPTDGGIERWPQSMCAELVASGTQFICGSTVRRIVHAGDRLQAVELSHGGRLPCDRILWTGSPEALLGALGQEPPPEAPYRPAALYHFVFDRPFTVDNHYVLCYDPSYRSFRITLYPNLRGRPDAAPFHCTVEAIGEKVDRNWHGKIREELDQMGLVSPAARMLQFDFVRFEKAFPLLTRQYIRESLQRVSLARSLCPEIELAGKSKLDAWSLVEVPRDAFAAARRLESQEASLA